MVDLLHRIAAPAAVVLIAGCAASTAPDGSAVVERAADQLERQQETMSAQALAGLAKRTCPAAPATGRLETMPDDDLACLGSGAALPADAADGRPTVVNLWASWCAPCVREMPILQGVSSEVGDAVRFVGVDTEDESASAAALLDATGVTYEQRDDPDAVVRAALRAVGLPTTVVFDGRGRLVARKVGEVDAAWLRDALSRAGVPAAPAVG